MYFLEFLKEYKLYKEYHNGYYIITSGIHEKMLTDLCDVFVYLL